MGLKKLLIALLLCLYGASLPPLVACVLKVQSEEAIVPPVGESAAPEHAIHMEYDLTDETFRRGIFFQLLERRLSAHERAVAPIISFQFECNDDERAAIAHDQEFQNKLFNLLWSRPSLRILALNNIGSEWVLAGMTTLPDGIVNQLSILELNNLELPAQTKQFNRLLARLRSITGLFLPNCGLTDFRPLAALLKAQRRAITTFKVADNNFEGQDELVQAALSECLNMDMLDCRRCGLTKFPIAPSRGGRKLERILVSGNDLSHYSGEELRATFSRLAALEALEICECGLTGLNFLAALPVNKNLVTLVASNNNFSFCSVQELSDTLRHLEGLQELVLDDCQLSDPEFLLNLPDWSNLSIAFGGENFRGMIEKFVVIVMDSAPRQFKKIYRVPMVAVDHKKAAGVLYAPIYLALFPAGLESLDLSGSNFLDKENDFLRRLRTFEALKVLRLRNCRLRAADLFFSIPQPSKEQMELLDLRGNFFTDAQVLERLPDFPALQELMIDNINERLGVARFSGLEYSQLERLICIPSKQREKIVELCLQRCNFTQAGWCWTELANVLSDFPALKRLRIVRSKINAADLDEPSLELCSLFERLEAFDLTDTEFVDHVPGMSKALIAMKEIKQLRLASCGFGVEKIFSAIASGRPFGLQVLEVGELPTGEGFESDLDEVELLSLVWRVCPQINDFDAGCLKLQRNKGHLSVAGAQPLPLFHALPEGLINEIKILELPGLVAGEKLCGELVRLLAVRNSVLEIVSMGAVGSDDWVTVDVRAFISAQLAASRQTEANEHRPLLQQDGPVGVVAARDSLLSGGPEEVERSYSESPGSGLGMEDLSDDDGTSPDELVANLAHLSIAPISPHVAAASSEAGSGSLTCDSSSSLSTPGGVQADDDDVVWRVAGRCVRSRKMPRARPLDQPVDTEELYVYWHPAHGEITLKGRPWEGSPGRRNFSLRNVTYEALLAHCNSSDLVDPRVRLNLAEFYRENNEKDDLAHAFDVGAIAWILRHEDTRAFIFNAGKIAFILPVSVSWLDEEGRVRAVDRVVICTFDQQGVLHHACMHRNVDLGGRYHRITPGALSLRAAGAEGEGIVFRLNA